MPALRSAASASPLAVAPDGIGIHGFALPASWLMSMVEGRIQPGWHGLHRHLTLDQVTYVLEGEVTAITDGVPLALRPGEALLTVAGESLQFVNEGNATARVLFLCAPPYPADDADTVTLAQHAPVDATERAAAHRRLQGLRAALNTAIDARLAALA